MAEGLILGSLEEGFKVIAKRKRKVRGKPLLPPQKLGCPGRRSKGFFERQRKPQSACSDLLRNRTSRPSSDGIADIPLDL